MLYEEMEEAENWKEMFMKPLDTISFYDLNMGLIKGNPLRRALA